MCDIVPPVCDIVPHTYKYNYKNIMYSIIIILTNYYNIYTIFKNCGNKNWELNSLTHYCLMKNTISNCFNSLITLLFNGYIGIKTLILNLSIIYAVLRTAYIISGNWFSLGSDKIIYVGGLL